MAKAKKVQQRKIEWEAEFTQDKVCKHSVRYALNMPNGQAFTVYVPNSILSNPVPQTITLSIN